MSSMPSCPTTASCTEGGGAGPGQGPYFGSLVQDYKVYSLEMMSQQTSSTEMLQKSSTMMTQLKSYLLRAQGSRPWWTRPARGGLGRSGQRLGERGGGGGGCGMIPDSPPSANNPSTLYLFLQSRLTDPDGRPPPSGCSLVSLGRQSPGAISSLRSSNMRLLRARGPSPQGDLVA